MNDKSRIVAMFATIDACRWHELGAFFAPDCVYERPGFARIVGLAALRHFYQQERPIERGVHNVDSLLGDGALLCAVGRFDGTLRNGSAIALRFSDLYEVRNDLVVRRSTYFYTPLA